MKILISGKDKKGALPDSFSRALKKLGHSVINIDDEKIYEDYTSRFKILKKNRLLWRVINFIFWKRFSQLYNKELYALVKKENPDLVIILKGWHLNPETIKKIKGDFKKLKVFCWNGDNPFDKKKFSDSNAWMRKSIPLDDVYFIWAESLVKPIKRAGGKIVKVLPVAHDPELHYPVKVNEKEMQFYGSDIAFIGTWDKDREKWLSNLMDYNLKIWGNSWENANPKLQKYWTKKESIGEDFSKVCNLSKIIINFVRKPKIPSHNMRTFEIPACKGFQLSNRTKEVLSFFEEGKEIACFDSLKELKEKIDYYLKNDKERKKISKNGFKKVKGHTYVKRMKELLKVYYKLKTKI